MPKQVRLSQRVTFRVYAVERERMASSWSSGTCLKGETAGLHWVSGRSERHHGGRFCRLADETKGPQNKTVTDDSKVWL